jgi:dienelactone hydrolase
MRILPACLGFLGMTAAEEAGVKIVPYRLDTLAFEGLLVMPSAAKEAVPAVLLFPDWMGAGPTAVDYARRVAEWGYAVFIADVYGKGVRPKDALEAGRVSGHLKQHVPLLRKRGNAALSALKLQSGIDTARVAALGFCFGGGAALELARAGAPLKAVASVHGNLASPFPNDAGKIRGKVLVLHGADDPYVLPDQVNGFVESLRRTKVDWQMIHYGGAVHAFTNPGAGGNSRSGAAYDAVADRRAFAAMKAFFAESM